MSTKSETSEKYGVTLLRIGVGKQEFELAEGETLGDLLRLAEIDPTTQAIFIDAKPLQDLLSLRQGMIVSVIPDTRDSPARGAWRETVGMFRDDREFEEMVSAGRAIREAERNQERGFS